MYYLGLTIYRYFTYEKLIETLIFVVNIQITLIPAINEMRLPNYLDSLYVGIEIITEFGNVFIFLGFTVDDGRLKLKT